MNTPICDFVRSYAESAPLRLHMPGHKGAGPLGAEALDITEIPGADVLYAPEGIVAESEKNAAALFDSAKTVYSTEGSSLCIRAMLRLALLRAEEARRAPLILAGRNAHKTFLSAAALLDLRVEWLDGDGGILTCAVGADELARRLDAMAEKPVAVYITSPDYLGNRLDVAALAEVCHARDILLLADNAHGAYLNFMSTPMHPLRLGADLVCDSAHKTLPVLTGGAYLHIAKSAPQELCEAADRAMSLFASTSPSYLILQSLDAVNGTSYDDYVNIFMSTAQSVAALRGTLRAEGWTLTGNEPLKLTLCPKPRGYTGTEVADALAARGIFAEFADPDYIVFMFTPSLPDSAFETLLSSLRSLPVRPAVSAAPPVLCKHKRVLTPRQAMLAPAETLHAEQATGRVLAAPGVSCPPAVPILICGEEIDDAAVEAFRYYGISRLTVVREAVVSVDVSNLADAAAVHAAAWQESHRAFCAPDFVAAHTPERQARYFRDKLARGSRLYLLLVDKPVAVVSVTGSLIEDLYVLPERQNLGFGTKLLRFAAERCEGTPTLWVLENNTGAARLYERMGFAPTGRRNTASGKLAEVEYRLT